jgi:spermidine synthase
LREEQAGPSARPLLVPENNLMLPWSHLGTAKVPGGGELRLLRRGAEFSIRLGTNELMNSRLSATEQALATMGCAAARSRPHPKILIGGLGMGFTLRAALVVLGEQADITVAELVPGVVAWARGPMAELFGNCLSDPRVRILETDVGDLIRAARSQYDAILLDVDNGPEGMTRKANDRLYDHAGLAAASRALRPSGMLAVWSSKADPSFTLRLRESGFEVVENPVRAKGPQGGAQHFIWTATRGDGVPQPKAVTRRTSRAGRGRAPSP